MTRLGVAIWSRPLGFVFLVALVVRLVGASVVAIAYDGAFFNDDKGYLILIDQFSRHATGSWEELGTWDFFNSQAGFLLPIGLLFRIFGSHPILGQALSAMAGAVTAAAVASLVRPHVSRGASLMAGLAVSLLPGQVLWSSLVLKDSFSWMSLVLIALALRWWNQRFGPSGYVKGFALLTALSFYLVHLRVHTFIVACIASGITVLVASNRNRIGRLLAVLLLGVVMPMTVGATAFGIKQLYGVGHGLDNMRQNMALGARTSIFGPEQGTNVSSGDLAHLPTGIRLMLLDPLPNQLHKSPNMKYPFVEHLLWYPMLILGLVGVWVIVKRRKTASIELVYTIFVIGGLAVMWGLVEGNFGTAYRHRGELVWGIAVLDGFGIDYLLGRRKPRPTTVDKQ